MSNFNIMDAQRLSGVKSLKCWGACDVSHRNDIKPYWHACHSSAGIDTNLLLSEVVAIAHKVMKSGTRVNIIIKAGPKAMWYLKYCPQEEIEDKIAEQANSKSTAIHRNEMFEVERK